VKQKAMSDPSTTELVQQGLTAARVGDVEEARRLLIEATHQTPANIEAWLGLAGVVETLEEKKDCFAKVLELAPDNHEAEAGLALVEQKLADQNSKNVAPETGLGYC
jgi:Flp pilus assembly protein TadD